MESFLPLDLVGVDVVLGMQWLHTLGETRVDWTTLTIRIENGHEIITLKGDPSLTKTKVSLKRMMRTFRTFRSVSLSCLEREIFFQLALSLPKMALESFQRSLIQEAKNHSWQIQV